MSIEDITDTYTQYKSKSVPLEGIRFPANLGLVLTQLTTWDDWRTVQIFMGLALVHFQIYWLLIVLRDRYQKMTKSPLLDV